MSTEASETVQSTKTSSKIGGIIRKYWPGLAIIAVLTIISLAINHFVPLLNAMLIAIVLGAVVANIRPAPASWDPGIKFSSKKLLRTGIVLLGLQISLQALAGLGWERLVLVILTVTVGVVVTIWLGRLLGINRRMSALTAAGFSICGASAVASTKDIVDAKEEETGTVLAMVTLLGTIMIPALPALASVLNLSPTAAGTWVGASVPEVAQVVAAGAALGEEGLAVAVAVKLARVVCLAGVTVGLSLWIRKVSAGDADQSASASRPPLIPGFVIGFLIMVVLTSIIPFPAEFLSVVKIIQDVLLTMAMAALGFGIELRRILKVGARPLLLAVLSVLIVAGVSLVGVLLIG